VELLLDKPEEPVRLCVPAVLRGYVPSPEAIGFAVVRDGLPRRVDEVRLAVTPELIAFVNRYSELRRTFGGLSQGQAPE
jgi:hypothetical protein